MFKVELGEGKNFAVFELFPCLLRAKQNEIKGDRKRRVNKVQTQGDSQNHISSGFSKELNVQTVSYFKKFLPPKLR